MSKLDQNYGDLRRLFRDYVTNQQEEYDQLLLSLRSDFNWNDKLLLGLERAPAAKKMHHAFEGGLVQHMLEMWEFWISFRNIFRKTILETVETTKGSSFVNDENVLKGILHHDLHKAYACFELEQKPAGWGGDWEWRVNYSQHPTQNLMTNDQKSFWILNQHGIKVSSDLANALFMAEGGWTRDKPRCYIALAVIITCVDALSGSALEKMRMGQFLDEFSITRGHQT